MNLDNEVAFSLSLKPRALRSMTLDNENGHESLVGGTLGKVEQVSVVDGVLLEIHGTHGILRLSLPGKYLARFEPSSSAQGDR